jgi:endonuclease-3
MAREGTVARVGFALRLYGEDLAAMGAAQTGGAFTDNAAADALVKSSPEAFLFGVLFTQGIPAERAWAGPYLLRERLGTLDLQYLLEHPEAVRAAFARPPALHRFVKTVPRWVSGAALRILSDYHGSAAAVWPDGAHVLEVTKRLLAFDGIGEKKAAMAVEILIRHFGTPLVGVECGNVAYDVQVRRVFLRAGLVDDDTPDAVRGAAARICPESPGLLDLPAWLIGRESCRPTVPLCDTCRLSDACPRFVERAVVGVGARTR